MKANILKTLTLTVLVTCFGKMNAQSDLLAISASASVSAPAQVAALFNEQKISVSDFTQGNSNSLVRVNCSVPVTMQVKVFNMNGEMAKMESHVLNSGTTDMSVNLDNLEAGTYMVQFYTKEGSAVRRFIKNN